MRVKRGYKKKCEKKKKKNRPESSTKLANLHEELLLTGTAVLQLKQGKEKTKCKLFQSLRKNINFFLSCGKLPQP